MDQISNYKHKIDFLLSNDTFQAQTAVKQKPNVCNECNRKRKFFDESHQYTLIIGNRIAGKMVFVPFEQFKNVEYIAEGGFIVLKKLNNSKSITSKELNELKVFHEFSLNSKYRSNVTNVGIYFGITQDPVTKDIMILMPYYYNSGDLIHYLSNDFYNINWKTKLCNLRDIIYGLKNIHIVHIIHRDFHSGNIFFDKNNSTYIGDLGISKSATESIDNNNENYGIIPYMAPEMFQRQKYTEASDIYSFSMIMWEFIIGRRSFWNRAHDAE
ncbi:kinase-like protein [Rhizophagus irregularis]|uniref:Kinase-like protein n=1 Tax=Rhizophagus irregularis TaxID=588596 RepID=A0A2N1NN04_9GLOM|nr:kinase-like protein [Rhizophagus irregularis]